VNNLRVGVLAQ